MDASFERAGFKYIIIGIQCLKEFIPFGSVIQLLEIYQKEIFKDTKMYTQKIFTASFFMMQKN